MPIAKTLGLLACLGTLNSGHAKRDPVPFPDGYRKWAHVHSALVTPGGGRPGFYHIYANESAMRGYATGHFPNGSVIAFDLFDFKVENNVTTATTRKLVDVMQKDASSTESGGWRFEELVGDARVRKEGIQAQCAHVTRRGETATMSSAGIGSSAREALGVRIGHAVRMQLQRRQAGNIGCPVFSGTDSTPRRLTNRVPRPHSDPTMRHMLERRRSQPQVAL